METKNGAGEGLPGRHVYRMAVLLVIVAVGALLVIAVHSPANGEVVDGEHVKAFDANPPYINLHRLSTISVEILQMHTGTGEQFETDRYLVTAVAPDGAETSTWLNFTSVGALNASLGNVSSGLMTAVDQVGMYRLSLEYFDGSNYTLAGVAQVEVTDKLNVVLETRIASNEYTDAHTCPISTDFQRGAEFVGGAWVYYASTGEPVTNLVETAKDNIVGTILGEAKVLGWKSYASNWHTVWFFPWDAPVGTTVFTVNASDGQGNTGSARTGTYWNTAVNIGPAVLTMSVKLLNETGTEAITFQPGGKITVEAKVAYSAHNAHNKVFAGPLTPTRGGVVNASLGWGFFNATTGKFNETLTNISLTYDQDAAVWRATYTIPAGTANITSLQAVIFATDGAGTPPNSGKAFTTMFSIKSAPQAPPPPPPPPEEDEVEEGFSGVVVGGLSIVTLLAGLGIGVVVSRNAKQSKKGEN